jgi:hypothetical protein
MLAKLPGLLARLVRQLDRRGKLRPLGPGGLQLAHALFPLSMPLGGAFGLVVAVARRLAEGVVQAVTLGPKLSRRHPAQVHRAVRVGGQLLGAVAAHRGGKPLVAVRCSASVRHL